MSAVSFHSTAAKLPPKEATERVVRHWEFYHENEAGEIAQVSLERQSSRRTIALSSEHALYSLLLLAFAREVPQYSAVRKSVNAPFFGGARLLPDYNPKPRYLPIPTRCPTHKCLKSNDLGEAAGCRTFAMNHSRRKGPTTRCSCRPFFAVLFPYDKRYCGNPGRGWNQSDQTSHLTGLAS